MIERHLSCFGPGFVLRAIAAYRSKKKGRGLPPWLQAHLAI